MTEAEILAMIHMIHNSSEHLKTLNDYANQFEELKHQFNSILEQREKN